MFAADAARVLATDLGLRSVDDKRGFRSRL
jgi:hypothetical protein